MRQLTIIASVLILTLQSFSVYAQKEAEVTALFPKEMALPVQAQFKELWDKGKILYGTTCAKCHNVRIKRKSYIPDFSADQLRGYEIRVINAEHETSMPDELVTAEELMMISTFLQYKAPSGVTPQQAAAKHKKRS